MFPRERLKRLNVSDNVLSFTPQDFRDMDSAFSGEKVDNPKVQSLTAHDLQNIEDLFSGYRREIIANFQGMDRMDSIVNLAAGDSCCCCCTPCCCCCAAVEIDPFRE